jgi:hypothetical protein
MELTLVDPENVLTSEEAGTNAWLGTSSSHFSTRWDRSS